MKKILKKVFKRLGYKIVKTDPRANPLEFDKENSIIYFFFNIFNFKSKHVKKIERFIPLEKNFLGEKLYIHDIASFDMCLSELFHSEAYNFKANNKNPYIIDCGANLGMSVIYFKQLYPEASILAFEADESIFSFLEKNILSYKYNDVQLINKAVWESDGIIDFLEDGGAGGKIEVERIYSTSCKKISSTRLKKYLTAKKVDFLKIDIEGAEYRVLKDCSEELKNIDFIFVEYHSMNEESQNLHKILEIIQNAGFRYHLKEAHTSKYPFIERDLNYGMDLQLNIFCYKD